MSAAQREGEETIDDMLTRYLQQGYLDTMDDPLDEYGKRIVRRLQTLLRPALLAARADAERYRIIAENNLDVWAPDSPHGILDEDGNATLWTVASLHEEGQGKTLGEAVDAYRAAVEEKR